MNLVVKIALGIILAGLIIFVVEVLFFTSIIYGITRSIPAPKVANRELRQIFKKTYSSPYATRQPAAYYKPREIQLSKEVLYFKNTFSSGSQYIQDIFQSQEITYRYDFYRINENTICKTEKYDIARYSTCTIKAKQYFSHQCRSMQVIKNKTNDSRFIQIKNMFCRTASTFKPTVASMKSVKKVNTRLEKLKVKCNDLIFEAMVDDSPKLAIARDRACKKYDKMDNR